MPRSVSTVARDLRDVCGAAALSLGFFGAPLALAMMQLDTAPYLHLAQQAQEPRQATFVISLPPPELAPAAPEPEPEPEPKPQTEPAASADASPELTPATVADAVSQELRPTDRHTAPRALRAGVLPRPDRPTPSSKSTRRERKCQDASDDIRALDDHSFEIERSLVDLYVNDLKLAQTLASVAWHRDDRGRIDGFRVRRIRCGTVLHQAGFRNDDVVHSVNGKKIRTVFGAIAAYRKLKRKDHLRIDATDRDGASKNLRYRIS